MDSTSSGHTLASCRKSLIKWRPLQKSCNTCSVKSHRVSRASCAARTKAESGYAPSSDTKTRLSVNAVISRRLRATPWPRFQNGGPCLIARSIRRQTTKLSRLYSCRNRRYAPMRWVWAIHSWHPVTQRPWQGPGGPLKRRNLIQKAGIRAQAITPILAGQWHDTH